MEIQHGHNTWARRTCCIYVPKSKKKTHLSEIIDRREQVQYTKTGRELSLSLFEPKKDNMDTYRSHSPYAVSKVGTSSSWWPSIEGHEYLINYEVRYTLNILCHIISKCSNFFCQTN